MSFYIDNWKAVFNIQDLMKSVNQCDGDRRTFNKDFFDLSDPGMQEIKNLWESVGYEESSIEWYNYYAGIHFDQLFADKFAEQVNAESLKVWVSKILPGKFFPRHWDVDTDTSKYQDKDIVRYHMHLKDYEFGHFFVLEDEYIAYHNSGDVYKWKNHKVWHAGGNIGITPKFIFNFVGGRL